MAETMEQKPISLFQTFILTQYVVSDDCTANSAGLQSGKVTVSTKVITRVLTWYEVKV